MDAALDSALREAFGELAVLPGETLGGVGVGGAPEKYEVVRALGEGGMGEVVLAHDRTLQREVALKSIRAAHRLNEQARARFLREARILAELEHPNICRIHDYVVGVARDYLVLEYVDGETLSEVLRRQPSFPERLDIARAVASVLAAAHAAGIVHRDLKPGNVMLAKDGAVKVLDFGISSSLEGMSDLELSGSATSSHPARSVPDFVTEFGDIVGTPAYMSPEQARGASISVASDMFAFGLLLQELFTGQPARRSDLDLMCQIEEAQRGHVRALGRVDRDVRSLLADLLRVEPAHRPSAESCVLRIDGIRTRTVRRLRYAGVISLVTASALAGVKYVYDLREKNRAISERVAVAEALLATFSDFREPLEEAGRLDLLERMADGLEGYFAELDPSSLSRAEMARQVEQLYEIGRLHAHRGNLEDASRAFDASLRLAEAECATHPDDLELLFELGQTEFWVGHTFREQGADELARAHLDRYAEISAKLVQRDPANAIYALERAYSQMNLGVLDLDRGDVEGALGGFDRVVSTLDGFGDRYSEAALAAAGLGPDELALELADAHSWRARASIAALDFGQALSDYQEERRTYEALVAADPKNTQRRAALALTENHVAILLFYLGRVDEASSHIDRALELSRELVEWDTENTAWRREAAVNRALLADFLASAGDPGSALVQARRAVEEFEELVAMDPSNKDWRQSMVNPRAVAAEASWRLGAPEAALAEIEAILGPEAEYAGDASPSARAALQALKADILEEAGQIERAQALRRRTLLDLDRVELTPHPDLVKRLPLLLGLGETEAAAAVWSQLRDAGYAEPGLVRLARAAGLPSD